MTGRNTDKNTVEAMDARKRLMDILSSIPHLDPQDPQQAEQLEEYKTTEYRHKVRERFVLN